MSKRKHQKRHRVTTKEFTPVANPEWAMAMAERGRSSATQRHALKSRKGTRRERARQAIHDQRG